MSNKIESVVIVTNKYGKVASLRFADSKDDREISSSNAKVLYSLIEQHVKRVQKPKVQHA